MTAIHVESILDGPTQWATWVIAIPWYTGPIMHIVQEVRDNSVQINNGSVNARIYYICQS